MSAILAILALPVAAAPPATVPLTPAEADSHALPGPIPAPQMVPDRIIVKLRADTAGRAVELPVDRLPQGLSELDAALEQHGIRQGHRLRRSRTGAATRDMSLFKKIGFDRLYVLQLDRPDEDKVREIVRELSREPWVEYAQPVYRLIELFEPNDDLFDQQWAHKNTGQSPGNGTPGADLETPVAWDTNTGAGGVAAVAVLDSGIMMSGTDASHEDLIDNTRIDIGYDYVNNDEYPNDTGGHGTAVAGIAAGVGNNTVGIAGMCHGCEIYPYRISTDEDETNAVMDAADNGADTINMSHTFGCQWLLDIKDAMDYAVALGTLPVASAANFDGYACSVPAAFETVVSAGGTDPNDNRIFTYSDYSEVGAPGTQTWSTALGGGYTLFGGTSGSAPHVSGLGALLRSERGDLHVNQLRHTIRLGAEDQIGTVPDPPGWDIERGYGRINAANSMALLTQKWIALDRAHYFCEGDVTIAVQDATAGAMLDVTIGSGSGDSETVTLTKVAGSTDYYEGTIPLNWTDAYGPGSSGDGMLDATHGDTFTATDAPRAASAFFDCEKRVCPTPVSLELGDCDGDGSGDPGETRELVINLVNLQTEVMQDVTVVLTSDSPYIELPSPGVFYGEINPFTIVLPENGPTLSIKPGAPPNTDAVITVNIFGRGFVSNADGCAGEGYANDDLILPLNREKGAATANVYTFDGLDAFQGFSVASAHGTGELLECSASYTNPWAAFPLPGTGKTERGWGTTTPVYPNLADGALVSAAFTVPGGGGSIGWYHKIASERNQVAGLEVGLAWDGLILEAKRTGESTWSYLSDASYNHSLFLENCDASFPFGMDADPHLRMFAGDGLLSAISGDDFDREHLADLSEYAGDEIQVRWRFGSDEATDVTIFGPGVVIDTITVYDAFEPDAWTGEAPQDIEGSSVGCDAEFAISVSAVAGATSYDWYRSEVSCADALASQTVFGTTGTSDLTDGSVVPDTEYFYAVQAGEGCKTTARACMAGGCCTDLPVADPAIAGVDKMAGDVLFTLKYAGAFADVYRDPNSDPSAWGPPFDPQVSDESGDEDFQYTDVGGQAAGALQYYIFTGSRCGNTEPPRPGL